MVKHKWADLKLNFPQINARIETRAINWLIAFFCFASIITLFSDRLPSFLRQYSFQVFLLVAIIEIAISTGWRPLLQISVRSLNGLVILLGAYFGGLGILNLLLGRMGYEGIPAESIQRNDLLLLSVVAPFVEEIFFRDLVFRSLYHRIPKIWVALVLSNVLFMVAHLSLYGGAFILGVCTTLLLMATGNLWLSIVFHSISNLSLVFLPLYFPNVLKFLTESQMFLFFYR